MLKKTPTTTKKKLNPKLALLKLDSVVKVKSLGLYFNYVYYHQCVYSLSVQPNSDEY